MMDRPLRGERRRDDRACAICEIHDATVLMADGRGFCGSCARKHPERGAALQPDSISTTEAYGNFVAMKEELARAS